jgi:hypothetical protein
MVKNINVIVDGVLGILNDSSIVPKPHANYSGSFFFGPNQEIAWRNQAPKGRVTPGINYMDGKSFGRPFNRSNHYNINIDFLTVGGYVGSNGLKNSELVSHYMSLIEDALVAHRVGNSTIEEMRVVFEPQIMDSAENNIWGSRLLVVFEDRK